MALTEEELLLQVNILASRISDNANMPFKSNVTLNKGLNPEYFSGNYTKIVNALNQLASKSADTTSAANSVGDKVNSILLDTDNFDNAAIWENVQNLMGQPTIIQGLEDILTGKRQDKILGLTVDDIGKVLTVGQDEDGNLVTKAIDAVLGGGLVSADTVAYSNEEHPEISNVKDAIDFLFNNNSGGVVIPENIFWEDIKNKPEIPTELSISENKLCLQNEDGILSSVDLTLDSDIDNIIEDLN